MNPVMETPKFGHSHADEREILRAIRDISAMRRRFKFIKLWQKLETVNKAWSVMHPNSSDYFKVLDEMRTFVKSDVREINFMRAVNRIYYNEHPYTGEF